MPALPGPLELVLILVIVTMLFGVGKLPEVFGAVGRGVKEFRSASKETDEALKEVNSDPASTESAAESS